MDRREFLQTATLIASAAGASGALAATDGAAPGPTSSVAPPPAAPLSAEPRTRRFTEQRWALDRTIQAVGMDWDQARSAYLSAPCGPEANLDFAAIRQRIQKLADAAPAFEATARRREAKARAAEEADQPVTARDNYFMAAVHWGAAQWPIDAVTEQNLFYNARKRDCFARYAKLADHRVEAVWIPFQGKALPAWLHLPPGYQAGRLPAVVSLPGMDSFKEMGVALYGDRWLSRGIAVLAIDGPGQYESPLLGIPVSMPAWIEAGRAIMDWLAARPEIDAQRVGIAGQSFGSLFATVAAANEPRFRACAVTATCLEPGCHTIFEEASPTFKMRFMFMAAIPDEAAFDEFRKTLTWEGHAERLRIPYLCIVGEADELCPLAHTERMFKSMQAPRQLVIYQDSRHSVGGVPAANLGPSPGVLAADWLVARLAGKPIDSERWYVDAGGRITKTAL
jgi:dienelactone hydrolase